MTVTDEELQAVKKYMQRERDFTEDDSLIRTLYAAAVIYLRGSGVKAPSEDRELYDVLVWGLTLYYYDHRDAVSSEAAFPVGLRPILNLLKNTAVVDAAVAEE